MKRTSFIFFLSLFLGLNSFADDFFFKTHKTYVTSSSKEDLESLKKSLFIIKSKTQSNKVTIDHEVETFKNGYKLTLRELLPAPFSNLISKSQKNGEANCYNTALVFLNILPTIRFTSPSEFSFYLKSPLCTRLKQNDKFQPGDIVNFGGHAGIFLTENILFNKVSNDIGSPWRFDHVKQPFNYGIDLKFLSNCNEGIEGCHVEIYRCSEISDYLESNFQDQRLIQIDKELIEIESLYQNVTLSSKKIKNKQKTEWKNELIRLKKNLNEVGEFSFEDEHQIEKFYFNTIYYRLRSLSHAIEDIFPIF